MALRVLVALTILLLVGTTAFADGRVIADALEAGNWAAVVMGDGENCAFGLRFATANEGILDGRSVYDAVTEVGPHSPDSSYCRLKWRAAPGLTDHFSARWQGQLNVPEEHEYTFFLTSDDGSRLYVDDKIVVDQWRLQAGTTGAVSVRLAKGKHAIKLEYFESAGGAIVRLEWASGKIKRAVIPESALSSDDQPGLRGEYFYGENFDQPAFSKADGTVDFNWGQSGPKREGSADPIACLEWSRTSAGAVVGKISLEGDSQIDLLMLTYFPWDYQGSYSVSGGVVTGNSSGRRFALVTSPAPVRCLAGQNAEDVKLKRFSLTAPGSASDGGAAGLMSKLRQGMPVYFAASIDGTPKCEPAIVEKQLRDNERRYLKQSTEVEGPFSGAGESLTNNIHWMRLLIPHTDITYLPAGRTWVGSAWRVFEWDGFFNTLLASVENRELAKSTLHALFKSQLDDGNIPNFGGGRADNSSTDRSQPQVGAYCFWKLYNKLGKDRELLKTYYPALVKWHKWWLADAGTGKPRRDGNNDGLLEWGSDRGNLQAAKYESGMDDSPLFDDAKFIDATWTMNMNSVDCSSLYALDALCLAKMARELGRKDDEEQFRSEYAKLKKLINERLWSEQDGMYLNRYWDGTFCKRIGCANLYPLVAGVATSDRARRMMESFNDPRKFAGEWMIPTISRDDPAFADQQYWRGTVWPPTNYLAYEGIKAYGFDSEAAILAESGARMFLRDWREHGTCRENFRSDSGLGGGQKYQSWGPLYCLALLQEFADVDIVDGGLRFGSFIKTRNTARNVHIGGDTYQVEIGDRLRVVRGGKEILSADGPVVVRGYCRESGKLIAAVNAARNCVLTISEKGLIAARVDGKARTPAKAGRVRLSITQGSHSVVCECR